MGAVTYPDPAVQAVLARWFVPCELNVKDPQNKPVVEGLGHTWTPDFRVLAHAGAAQYAWSGFLPPSEFIAQALVAAGYVRLCLKDNQRSADAYQEVLRAYSGTASAPEAAYFHAVARYRLTGNREELRGGWAVLQRRYPNSIWREKQIYDEEAG